jgi:hypothetical protein
MKGCLVANFHNILESRNNTKTLQMTLDSKIKGTLEKLQYNVTINIAKIAKSK